MIRRILSWFRPEPPVELFDDTEYDTSTLSYPLPPDFLSDFEGPQS